MSQISPPVRILLIGSVVFLAAWFAFLRPGGGADTPAPAPAPATAPAEDPGAQTHSAVGRVVQKAATAKQQAEAASAKAAGGTAAEPAGTAPTAKHPAPAAPAARKPAAPARDTAGLPLPVARAVARHKVLALLFWNPRAADDRAVRRAMKGVDRHHGKVFVKVADVGDIARYAPITRGVDVQQSPSVVVVDRRLQGSVLTGYVDRVTIDQAVSDALRAG